MNDYGKTLPMTGAGITIGGLMITGPQMVALAIGLVAIGALLIKISFRRGKAATTA